MVKVCAIYVRKSKVNDNSDSMETQIQMCTDYLNQQFPGCIIKIYDKDLQGLWRSHSRAIVR